MRVRTLSPGRPILAKEGAFTFASYLCLRCAANFRCVSGSRVGMAKNDYILSIKRKAPQTAAMAEGTRLHEEYAMGLPKPEDLGPNGYYERLRQGYEVVVREAYSCRMTGYRGKIDVLKVRREDGEYFVTIQENKSHPSGKEWFIKWMLQLAEYGYIFNSMDMNYIHGRENQWWRIFLPEDQEPVVNVNAYLHYLDGSRPDFPAHPFSVRNRILDGWYVPWVTLMLKKAKEKWPWHRRGFYMLDQELEDEPRPMFLGKRKLLVKNPPPRPPRDNFG